MKNIFLDTNILLDYLAQRQPFFADAEALFMKAEVGAIYLLCSSLSFSTIFYVLRKFQTKSQLSQTLNDLTQGATVTGVDENVI